MTAEWKVQPDLSKPSGVTKEMTLAQAIPAVCKFLAPRQGDVRQQVVRDELSFMAKVLGRKRPVGEITRQDMVTLLKAYKARGVNVVDPCLRIVSMFFKVCHQDGAIPINPVQWSRLPLPVPPLIHKVGFSHEQYEKVLTVCCDTRRYFEYWTLACKIAFHTGLRCGDVARLRWFDDGQLGQSYVDLGAELIVARPHKKLARRERLEIPLQPEVYDGLVYAWRNREDQESPHVLPLMRMHYVHTSRANITGQFRLICDEAGLPDHTFHSFRHGFVSRLINANISPYVIAEMTGQSLRVILGYSHIANETKSEALRSVLQTAHQDKLRRMGIVPEKTPTAPQLPPMLKL